MRQILVSIALALTTFSLQAQSPAAPDPPHHDWKASWITHPTAPLREPLVLHFRRTLTLAAVPESYVVWVSADNRFILYVNGRRVGDGPARGDLTHWRYERFDLAPLLKAGENLITATVWNWGVYAPIAQMTDRTAFLLESEAAGDASISTGVNGSGGWLVEIEPGQRAVPRVANGFFEYMASGPGEEMDSARYDWNWNSVSAGGANWVPAASAIRESIYPDVNRAHSADTTGDNPWGLIPDELPHMEYSATPAGGIVSLDDIANEQPGLSHFPSESARLPTGIRVHLLLDRKTLTTAYPQLTVSGGKGSKIILTYAEALYDKDQHKGDRDDVGDRKALGMTDSFLPDGGQHRTFEPLWWRTWRYLDLDIETGSEPLTLESLTAQFTAYPFQERASLTTPDPDLAKIWEISWRTARLDAHETYMDTPYYEQLQYVGDTRIQALISYAVGDDDRLARQALQAFDWSRIPEGITRSRYPSSLPQSIPTFSLIYVGMLHDYWMYSPDKDGFARALLPGSRTVLDWFANYEQPDGLLKKLPWWSFIDWVSDNQEIPTYDKNGESCVTTLEYLGALTDAADLESALGDSVLATRYQSRAAHVRTGLYDKCWSAPRGLLADTPDQKGFSQQANILGVLYDVIPKDRQQQVLKQMLSIDPGTTPDGVLSASYYFRFYLARALDHAGMADDYLDSIGPWRELLPLHFSTWPEVPGNTRSDSHAWSAHPIYDFLTLVAGIEPASPGFASVRIAPHLGSLPSLTATYPHPQGPIKVEYLRQGSGLSATITLPGSLTGSFKFGAKTWPLKPGVNRIQATSAPLGPVE
ncbi:MAG: alpha-L-rhamnosidase C-terminal domain-containing protein [Terracidiphilus sp.]